MNRASLPTDDTNGHHSTASRARVAVRWFLVVIVLIGIIMVPFFLFEGFSNTLSLSLVTDNRSPVLVAFAIALLLAADVALPIPSSIVSTASGALFGSMLGACISWVGMTLGCVVALGLGRWGGRKGLRRFIGDTELARAEHLAARYGAFAIVVARPVPVLAEASVLLAASCGMPMMRFVACCSLANAGISLVYAAVGAYSVSVSSFLLAFLGAILLPGVGFVAAKYFRVIDRSTVKEKQNAAER